MQDKALEIKLFFTAVCTAFTTIFGWFGWVVLLWLVLMVIDWITGSAAANKAGKWSSAVAREGIRHKGACIAVVACAGALDIIIGLILSHLEGFTLPFKYTVAFSVIVVLWYIFTEAGSIIENAGKLGAPIPKFLCKWIEVLKTKIEENK